MKKWKKYLPLIGVFLFTIILSRIDFFYYFYKLPPIKWPFILVSPILMAIVMVLKSWRWQIILKKQGIKYNFKETLKLYLVGIYLGAITPGRIGELGKIYYLKKDQQSLADSSIATILDKIADLVFVFIFGLIGLTFFYKYSKFNLYVIVAAAIIVSALIAFYYFVKKYLPNIHGKLLKINQKIKYAILNYRISDYLTVYALSISSWLIYFLIAYFFGQGVGISNINFWYVALVMSLASLASILPISIMGLGTRDSVFIFFYLLQGINREIAIAVSMLIFIINLLPVAVGFIIWLTDRKKNNPTTLS